MRIAPAPLRACATPHDTPPWGSGSPSLDAALKGGFAYGRVHEIYGADADDAAAVAGFGAAVAAGMAGDHRPVLWLRTRRAGQWLQASGWADLGGIPGNALVCVAADTMTLLRAAVDALRCAALGAVIVEGRGRMPELDLTASRRLVLTAERSGVPLLLLRADATPVASAALTRWEVAAAPSQALPGNAPGLPTFAVALRHQRSGPCGLDWRLEWNRDRRSFREAPLSGAVVPLPAERPAADTGGAERRGDRQAA